MHSVKAHYFPLTLLLFSATIRESFRDSLLLPIMGGGKRQPVLANDGGSENPLVADNGRVVIKTKRKTDEKNLKLGCNGRCVRSAGDGR
ncbi:MAG: hypothetical protein FWF97_04870 [Alphaproteobacteria bacterium]|nr:hypothetical protein [Alphaproteobacteria bacterium]